MGKVEIEVLPQIGHLLLGTLNLSKYVAHQWHVSHRTNTESTKPYFLLSPLPNTEL
jgi:hypothetical protein